MDQEKIGKFIYELRKSKKLTQAELAKKIGVTDRAISKWENGRGLPDLSLLLPLSNELDISINELLSGERLDKKEYQKKLEENLISAINYSNKKEELKDKYVRNILIIIGILMSFIAMVIFPSTSSWSGVYSVLGAIISLIGVSKYTKKLSYGIRLMINFLYFGSFVLLLFVVDLLGVIVINQAPRFAESIRTVNNVIEYKTPFYNVFRVNFDKKNEYYILDVKRDYTAETVPNVPFNRSKSGIDNILKYKMNNLDDIDKVKDLIDNLPLADLEYEVRVLSDDNKILINYNYEDIYDDYLYMERSLIYNVVSLYTIIDSLDIVVISINNTTYQITRENLLTYFPDIVQILQSDYKKSFFVDLFESRINDDLYINHNFKMLFVNLNISRTKKVEVLYYEEFINEDNVWDYKMVVGKTIRDEVDISKLINIVIAGEKYPPNTVVTSEGATWQFELYDENDKKITTLYGWQIGSIGFCGKEYRVTKDDVETLKLLAKIKD